jgi:hypothetical protein
MGSGKLAKDVKDFETELSKSSLLYAPDLVAEKFPLLEISGAFGKFSYVVFFFFFLPPLAPIFILFVGISGLA